MASPSYTREYREWLDGGNFERVYEDGRADLASAIESQRSDHAAAALQSIALCYYTRGAVSLLDGDLRGWNEIQCGYLATTYSIRLIIPLRTEAAVSRKRSERMITEAVMTLGLARLFAVSFDEQLLRDWLVPCFDSTALTGKVASGRCILESIFHASHKHGVESLRRDRKECCQKRDAWPDRPTERRPFGILDVEMAINFPTKAEFSYPAIAYSPIEDEHVIQVITAYHQWND
jgi:hypothetical protein